MTAVPCRTGNFDSDGDGGPAVSAQFDARVSGRNFVQRYLGRRGRARSQRSPADEALANIAGNGTSGYSRAGALSGDDPPRDRRTSGASGGIRPAQIAIRGHVVNRASVSSALF
jgi:hypothetical protein